MASDEFEYDVALSFAGEDRTIANKFADLLKSKGIKIFYDEYEAADMWGKDLIDHLVNIYSRKARYCVMFISQYYPLKKWTKVKRMAAQERAFRDANEYILPLRLDDTQVPGITETTGYRDLRQHSMESIVDLLEQKLRKSRGQSSPLPQSHDLRSGSVSSANTGFDSIPMPKRNKTFTQFEKDRFARESFDYVKQYFKQGLKDLEKDDPEIQTSFEEVTNFHFVSRIYVRGDRKVQCNIWSGDNLIPNSIYYNANLSIDSNSVKEYFSVDDNGKELHLHSEGFGIGRHRLEDPVVTQQQAAQHLWEVFISNL
jgi:hypothetical protein